MSVRSFFFGNISEEPESKSLLQDFSDAVESNTAVSLHQNSHTTRHGLLGLCGYTDESTRKRIAASDEWEAGNLTDEEHGQAGDTYHEEQDKKSGLRYFLGF